MISDLRDLIELGAEFVGNRNWMGQCPDVYSANYQRMVERQEQIAEVFYAIFGKVKGDNLIKRLKEHMI